MTITYLKSGRAEEGVHPYILCFYRSFCTEKENNMTAGQKVTIYLSILTLNLLVKERDRIDFLIRGSSIGS